MKVQIRCCCGYENLKNLNNMEWFYCTKCEDKYHISQLYVDELKFKHISEYYKERKEGKRMRYIIQIQENGKWIYDGAYDDRENAIDYAERCFYKEGLNARVIIETVEIIEEYIGM